MKQINRTAAVAWGQSSGQSPMLATGTLSGAFDASFSTNAELEVYDVSALGPHAATSESARRGHIEAPGRFNSLTWGGDGGSGGLIVGGLEDGTVCFWNAMALTNNSAGAFSLSSSPPSSSVLVSRSHSHQGNVKGLQFNKFQSNLLASGASDGEVDYLKLIFHYPFVVGAPLGYQFFRSSIFTGFREKPKTSRY